MHKHCEKAFAFIKKALAENLPVGKYEIDGKNLFASVQEYNTKEEQAARYEGHRNYIDIQFIASGAEAVEVTDITKTQSITPYNEEKDVEFFQTDEKVWKGVWTANKYGIFFPYDIHRPGMRVDGVSAPVKKILVKIKL
ncbi:MAG: YhcH/YjgK/YiaL family protein [Clostridia bacterium]|nr:YhcH/YjgK/YiaL family protein [Clostridia bacterium]